MRQRLFTYVVYIVFANPQPIQLQTVLIDLLIVRFLFIGLTKATGLKHSPFIPFKILSDPYDNSYEIVLSNIRLLLVFV